VTPAGLLALAVITAGPPAESPGEDKVVVSWQIQHPALSGLASGLTFGLWPRRYGDDARPERALPVMRQGLGVDAFQYVWAANEPIFRFWRISGVVLVAVAGLLCIRVWSRKRDAG
jgi:hypothetical protein